MSADQQIRFYPRLKSTQKAHKGSAASAPAGLPHETGTCTDAETFALQVRDDTMEPEFASGCIIIIDPTGRATDGAYVLADTSRISGFDIVYPDAPAEATETEIETLLFRMLVRRQDRWYLQALNGNAPAIHLGDNLDCVLGVIVQRAGKRRSYHKHYD